MIPTTKKPPRHHLDRTLALQYAVVLVFVGIIASQVVHAWHTRDKAGRYATVSRDFADFYCAGATRNAGQSPYLLRPFDACGTKGPRYQPVSVEAHRAPAPIPGYDVALFRVFAMLPFATAAVAWLLISIIALLTVVALIARLSHLPPIIVFVALALPCFRITLEWGQLMPVAMASLALAAFCVQTRRFTFAGIAVTSALIEPHLGLPACLAMFIFLPRARLATATACAMLALVSVVTLGIAANIEYVRMVVPLQIAAEAPSSNQMSLTWILYWIGVSQSLAIKLGILSYYVTVAAGLWLAQRCARAFDAPELIVLVPPAIAVIGGPFIHSVQTTVAILPALYFAGRIPRYAGYAWTAILSFALDWYSLNYFTAPWSLVRIESITVMIVLIAYALRFQPARSRVVWTAAGVLTYVTLSTALLRVPDMGVRKADLPAEYAASLGDRARYSVAEWGVSVRERPATNVSSTRTFFAKLPFWFGLTFETAAIVGVARRRGTLRPRMKANVS